MSVPAQCLPYPIAIPIGNITLSNGETARGAELAIGHPRQNFAFLPQWPLNNTLVYGTNGYCISGLSETGCTTWRGGQYLPLSSDTRRQPPSNPNPTDGAPYPKTTTYTDVFQLNDNVTIDDFAIDVALSDWQEQGYHPMMALGLGSNSTVLSALKAGNRIASRVWSIFYGLTGGYSNAQLDGVLVLGGYDQAKVSGQGYTLDLQPVPSCSTEIVVTVSDIILHFPNGTDASIVTAAGGGGFPACLVPDYPGLMTLADDPYFEEFQMVTNASITQRSGGQEFWTMLYDDGTDPFMGDMSINIQYGPSIRIPNSELVIPERTIDSSTGMVVANYSRSNLVINSLQEVNKNDISQLGRMFLSSAYVMVNQDSGQFTIWQANPTSFEDLVGVDSTGKEITTFCTNSTTPGTTAPGQTAVSSQNTTPTKLSSGAIAGIVVGAVAALAIVIGVLFWRRRRSRANLVRQPHPQAAPGGVVENPYAYPEYYANEQATSKTDPDMVYGIQSTPDRAELASETSKSMRSSMAGPRFELVG
ncbi:hypothetical protein O1611_g9317 [Lasiodiplodia mahajangana]|uniref:Uncharacterized protein n=1 Tax=Lasiodiplodia mahajangana TaxID=1108764 RepID=A0ACC2J9Y9_9PEZI|nr:hypothetical protein O1611_g9317 [Lasiodiplodia mahajangana]